MQLGVISNYKKENKMCNFCIISDDGNYNITGFKVCTENEVVMASKSLGLKLLNFSIDKDGSIKQDSGSFNRFHPSGVYVILAEIKNRHSKTLGYRVLESTTNTIVNKRTKELVELERKANRPVLQNGIIRNNTVNCYPLHQFPVIVLNDSVKKPKINQKEDIKKVDEKDFKKEKSQRFKEDLTFTSSQKKEITACRNRGINSKFIENPKLSPEQMRVLWVSKSKGVLSEHFASPDYSLEAMKFYADRLFNTKAVDACSELLKHPELTHNQLVELYMCIMSDIEYKDLIGKEAYDIATERMTRENLVWNNPTEISQQALEDDILMKAVAYAKKVRGY